MNTKEILIKARGVIAQPENWTKNTYARNKHGVPVLELPEACQFCAIGALYRAVGVIRITVSTDREMVQGAREELTWTLAGPAAKADAVPVFNDTKSTTHADVLKLFDDTIARLA